MLATALLVNTRRPTRNRLQIPMHFWIDKRSQTCGYSGRHRIPTSISANCGQQRRRRRRSGGKLMVTPVHRFQPIESVAVGNRRSHRQLHNYYPSPYSSAPRSSGAAAATAHSAELDSSVYLDVPLENHVEPTTHHQQGDFAPVGRLKCGMWVSFALATGFVAGAKFYIDHQGSGVEVLVFCALLSVFFLAGCTVSLCRAKVTRDLLAATVSTSQPPASVQSHELEAVITEVALSTLTTTSTAPPPPPPPELPPPPYHIAIFLPQQAPPENDESPPPSYEKAVS